MNIPKLKVGDIVRNRGSGNAYVVIEPFDRNRGSAIGIRTVQICSPSEWELFSKSRHVKTSPKV